MNMVGMGENYEFQGQIQKFPKTTKSSPLTNRFNTEGENQGETPGIQMPMNPVPSQVAAPQLKRCALFLEHEKGLRCEAVASSPGNEIG